MPAIPAAVTASGSRVRLVGYAPNEWQPRHAHERTTLTLVLRGSLEERVEGRVHRAAALSLVVKPAGTPHEDSFGPDGARTVQITLSESDEAVTRDLGSALAAWRWVPAGDAARGLLGMIRLLGRDGAQDRGTARIDDLVHEVLGALEPPAPSSGPPPRWLADVRGTLAGDPQPIRALASAVGVHPVHLAHAFRRHYGTTPSEYRRRARLHRAAAMLADTGLPLTEVALASGFADQAHLTRCLRRATGETPRTFRRLAAGA